MDRQTDDGWMDAAASLYSSYNGDRNQTSQQRFHGRIKPSCQQRVEPQESSEKNPYSRGATMAPHQNISAEAFVANIDAGINQSYQSSSELQNSLLL